MEELERELLDDENQVPGNWTTRYKIPHGFFDPHRIAGQANQVPIIIVAGAGLFPADFPGKKR
jgi:hypothetical protein